MKSKFNSRAQLKPKGNTSWRTMLCKFTTIAQQQLSHHLTWHLHFSDPILLGAFLPFPLVRGHSLRYKPGLLPGSGLYVFLCFGSWPSLWLLHFPRPARQSLGCLWNGSSAGLLWDVTEKWRSVSPSPLCSCRVPSGSLSAGLALLVFRLFVCVCPRKKVVYTFVCWGWAFLLFCFRSRCHIELVQQPAEVWLDWRTIFFQDCPGVPVAKTKRCCRLSFRHISPLALHDRASIFLLYPYNMLKYAHFHFYNCTLSVPAYQWHFFPFYYCELQRGLHTVILICSMHQADCRNTEG